MEETIDKDLQEIVDVVAEGVSTGIKAFADGYQIADAFAFIPVFTKIPAAVDGAENALHYLKDMSEEKENAIVDAVTAKLNDASDKTREAARRIVRLLAEAYMTIMFFKSTAPTA
jgi:hypothetical protein